MSVMAILQQFAVILNRGWYAHKVLEVVKAEMQKPSACPACDPLGLADSDFPAAKRESVGL
jgi:hypothetical protein